jgi:hypothetical protein
MYLGAHLGQLVLDLNLLILQLAPVLSLVVELLFLSLDHGLVPRHQLQDLGVAAEDSHETSDEINAQSHAQDTTPTAMATAAITTTRNMHACHSARVWLPLGVRFGLGRLGRELNLELAQLVF